ncbi:MAG: glycoside hydrolase [Candidatus Latescibacteria bacterium]|nr:glycoside hydrolase [Candidatus Latescibacterota bacterium]
MKKLNSLKKHAIWSLTVFTTLIFCLCGNVSGQYAENGVFNILSYGAKGDGVTINTQPIQKAIDVCSENGGEVQFPPGIYLSGTIFMKSNVTLRLMRGATLLGSPRLSDYPVTEPAIKSYTDNYVCRSLIYGENLQNIGITGFGTIDGNGHGPEFQEAGYKERTRPYLIRLINCHDVSVTDIYLTRSPMWLQHYLACENVRMRGVRVFNHGNRNNDSLDIDGCSDFIVSDCVFDSDDDGITFKSTSPYITENVTVTNCIVGSHCNAIKMGTESTGGFRNITISNCVVRQSKDKDVVYGRAEGLAGLALEIVDGGIMDQIVITGISIENFGTPLFIRLGNRARKHTASAPEPEVGMVLNVSISNITARAAGPVSSSITGIPGHPVENVILDNIRFISPGGGTKEDVTREVPEVETQYPESKMFGGPLPSSGLYVRHAKHVSLDGIRLISEHNDVRSAIVAEDVTELSIDGLEADAPDSDEPVVRLIDTAHVLLSACKALEGTNSFLAVEGAASKNITLSGCDLSRAKKSFTTGNGVPSGTVTAR